MESLIYSHVEKSLKVIDQRLLPHVTRYIDVKTVEDGWRVIREMSVRGAPAIAIVAVLALAVDLHSRSFDNHRDGVLWIRQSLDYLRTSRPTAVNLFDAMSTVEAALAASDSMPLLKQAVIQKCELFLSQDVKDNKSIGMNGGKYLLDRRRDGRPLNIITHCNTGALATAGYGTALGIIRYLHAQKALGRVYCTETRPYNQGARLTAYELVTEGIEGACLITDSMCAHLMITSIKQGDPIDAIIVGADRVAANGDTANKIGTYQLALLARVHGVKFIVAAPTTSIDLSLTDGSLIPIEERSGEEVKFVTGWDESIKDIKKVLVSPRDIQCWNPAFDITPANLIDAIVTEVETVERVGSVFVFAKKNI